MDASPLAIEVVLIDDGSRDDTALKIRQVALTDERYHGVFLSRNHGHQLALTAGISAARGTEALRHLADAYAAVVSAMSDSAATERRKGIS